MTNYDDIVKQIRADAARVAGDYNNQWAQAVPPAPTGPTFDAYAKELGYDSLDFEAKQQTQQAWLKQHGEGWRAAGANPEQDLKTYAAVAAPKSGGVTNTDWLDLAAQAMNRGVSSVANVGANAIGPGVIGDYLKKQGSFYDIAAKQNAADFSEATIDSQKKNARLQAEADKKYGADNVPLSVEAGLKLGELARNPLNFAAQTAGNFALQAPGYIAQGVGAALAATGAGSVAGAGLIAAGRTYGTISGGTLTAGEVGQGAGDEVMKLRPEQLANHPTYKAALAKSLARGINEHDAALAAQRAVASEAMNYGAALGLGVGAVGGFVGARFGAGAAAESAGKRVATEFLKRSGIEMATEGVEGYTTQVAQNVASRSGGVQTSLTRGALGAGIEEAAGGMVQTGAAASVGKAASTLVGTKAPAVETPGAVNPPVAVTPTTPETLAQRMENMPDYAKGFANDLVDTIIANPNPTPEVQADIESAKAQLLGFGFTAEDLAGLYAPTVAADAPTQQAPKDILVGTYKPSETGGAPNTEAPMRLVSELATAGPLTLEGVNQVAVDHEKGYSEWVADTQSQPSRVPSQQFISGTADNMVLTALTNNVPMVPELQAYAENLAATKDAASIDTDRNNLGSRLMADGKSLMTESDYQASQLGTASDLVGKYVLYGESEGFVVQRQDGLYVVDNRPGNTQDIFIEGGESESTPAQLGLKLMTPPKVSVPQQRQGAGVTPAGLVAEAQLNYEQILLNDALDILGVSMPAAEAEALLTQFDQYLDTHTPAQLAKEIENEINKHLAKQTGADTGTNDAGARPTPAGTGVNTLQPDTAGGPTSGTTTFGETAQRTEAVRAELTAWVTSLDPSLKGKTLEAMLPDVTVHDQLPMWMLRDLREKVYTGDRPMLDRTGKPTSDLNQALVSGARRPPLTVENIVVRIGRTHIFANNMADYQDPVGVLLHETWHKYQSRENVDQLRKSVEAWGRMPADSNEYKAWLAGTTAEARTSVDGGPQEFVPHAVQELWELGVRPTDKTRAGTWLARALDHIRTMLNRFLGRAPRLTAEDLVSIAVKLVQTDATGRARESKSFLSDKEQTRGVEPTAFSVADISKLTDRGRSLKEFSQQFAGDIKQADRKVEDADKIALDYFDKVIKDPSSVLPKVEGSTLSYQQYLKMPDGSTYDPNNINHITASDLTKSIYAAVQSGRIESALAAEAKATNESRAGDLRSLARYLRVSQDYVTTEAAVILKAASKWGMRLTTNNDKSEVQLVEITNKNATAIAVLNGLDASALAEQMKQGKPLKQAFRDALQTTVDQREKAAQASGKEGWVVYKKSDNHDDHVALRDGCAGREWCTAGAVSTAAGQLRRGDFHIFYKKGEPIVALRTVNGRLDEAPRGSLSGQALTPYEREVAERRLRGIPEPVARAAVKQVEAAPTVSGGQGFLDDQKVLTDIQSGAIKDYSDVDLWMLTDYKMKAGDYSGDALPTATAAAVKKATALRKPADQWHSEGYRRATQGGNVKDLATARVVSGNLALSGNASAPLVTTVGGDLTLLGKASAPLVTTVGGDLYLHDSARAPLVTTVGGDLSLRDDASAPLVTTVGRNLYLHDNARAPLVTTVGGTMKLRGEASAPLVTTVGGNLSLRGEASAPLVTTVGGNLYLSDNTHAPLVTNVGGDLMLSGKASAPLVTTVGGNMELHDNTSTPLVTTVGGSLTLNDRAIATLVTSVGRYMLLYDNSSAPLVTTVGGNLDLYDEASAPLVTTVGGDVTTGEGIVLPAIEAIGGAPFTTDNYKTALPNIKRVGQNLAPGEKGRLPNEMVVGKEAALKGTPLDPNYVAPAKQQPTVGAPTVTGGQDFLSDQKVLADIQSGAIKDYSDLDLWMLTGYKLKAGDYSGDAMPEAAKKVLKNVIASRKPLEKWHAEGYRTAMLLGAVKDLATARYVSGSFKLRGSSYNAPLLVAVGGDLTLSDGVQTPLLVSVNGNLKLSDTVVVPLLKTVGGNLALSDEASAPLVTTVDGDLVLHGNASAPQVTTVRGNLSLFYNTSAPLVTTVGGKLFVSENASAPLVTTVGGDLVLSGKASAPLVTTVGGTMTLQGNTSAPLVTTVGGDAHIYSNASAPLVTTVGGNLGVDGKASAPRVATVGGNVTTGKGIVLPAIEAIGGAPFTTDNYKTALPNIKRVGVNLAYGEKGRLPNEMVVGKTAALKGTPLDPNYVAPVAQSAAVAPTVTGGEDFLSDQKVLADIQSGAIKDYPDRDLWLLLDYRLKASDYTGDGLSQVMLKAIKDAQLSRRSQAAWAQMGYYDGGEMLSPPELSTARVIRGELLALPLEYNNLVYVSRLIIKGAGDYRFPALEKTGTLSVQYKSTATIDLPKLVETTGSTQLAADAASINAPKLKRIATASRGYDEMSMLGVYLPELEYAGDIAAADTTGVELYNGANLPKFAPSNSYITMVAGTKVYAPLLVPDNINFDPLYDSGEYDGPEPDLRKNFEVPPFRGAPVAPTQPAITGGEAFLDDQKVLADIQSGAISSYSDKDLWMLQGYKLKAGDYTGGTLPAAAKASVAEEIANRFTPETWNEFGYYTGATADNGGEVDYPADMRGVKYVSGAVNIMSDTALNSAGKFVASDLVLAGSVWVGYGHSARDIGFPKLKTVLDSFTIGGAPVPVSLPVLKSVGGAFHGLSGTVAPNLESIGGSVDDVPSELQSSFPKLHTAGDVLIDPSASLPNLSRALDVQFTGSKDEAGDSIPKLALQDISLVDMGDDNDFSIADYNPLKRKQPKDLADRLKIIEQGKLDTDIPSWQILKDWTARKLVDVTRPFDVWVRGYGNKAEQAKLVQDKSLAKTRASSLLSKVDIDYTAPLSTALKSIVRAKHVVDMITAKELVGTWMTVRYAQIQNAQFIKQDEEAVQEAETAFVAAGGNMVGLRAELQATTTTRPSQDKLTMRSDRAARRFAKATDQTRAAARQLAKALTEQEERLTAINNPDSNVDTTKDKQAAGLAGGYNNATAKRVQSLIEKRIPLAKLEAAAKPVYDMLKFKSDLDLRNGKVALSAHVKWLKHPHYVPLTGDPRSDDSTSDIFGTGSVNQGKDKKAEGRTSSFAQNGIDAAFEQMGKSAQYHGWLPFKMTLTNTYERLLRELGSDNAVFEKYGIKRHRENAQSNISDSIVFRHGADVSRNGGGWVYTLESQAAIDGLKGATLEPRPGWLGPVAMATTTVGRMITTYTGGFAVINALRDGPERFTNLATRKIGNYPDLNMPAVAAKAMAYWGNPLTLTAARQVVAERYKTFDTLSGLGKALPAAQADVAMLREMLDAGASSTTGAYLSRDSDDLAKKLSKITGGGTKAHNALVIWNDSFELKAPFAMYKALRTSGVDASTAAAVTLDAMNFGKAGEAMAPIKALYIFAQPTMTGGHQLAMTLSTRRGQVIAAAVALAAMGVYALVAEAGGEDPETKRKRISALSPETLSRNIPIIVGNDVYKIPVPFGLYHLAWSSVVNFNRYTDGTYTGTQALGEQVKLGLKTFSPVAPSDTAAAKDLPTWFVQTMTPTVLKPIANIATNTGSFGQALTNEASHKPGGAKWKEARKATPEFYVDVSKYLLESTGFNVFPESLQESMKLVSYGLVKDLLVDPFITSPDKDAKGIPRANPYISRWVGLQTDKSIVDSVYYDIKDKVIELREQKDTGRLRDGNPLSQVQRTMDLALKQSEAQESAVRKQWNELRRQENEGLVSKENYRARFQQLSKQELEIHKRFIIRYNELNK